MNASTVHGRIAVHPRAFGFLNVDAADAVALRSGKGPAEDVAAFIAPPDLNPFLDGDRVSAMVATDEQGRHSATGLTLVERTRTELFGTVTTFKKKRFLRVDRLVANTDWPFEEGSTEGLVDGSAVIAAIRGAKVVPIRNVTPGADLGLERVVVRHGIRSVFPPEIIEAGRAAATPKATHARRDLRELPTVTIDGPTTTDLDDALSVLPADVDGALRVLVSIADVDAFVAEGSALDDEAKLRGTSVYLAGRVIPMLPDSISSNAASLMEGQDRLALTVELRIDAEGHVRSTDVYESLIRSHARLTYDAVADYLATGNAAGIPEGVRPTIRWLRTAAARLSVARAARGGVDFAREEAYVHIDAVTREPTSVEPRGETDATRLVERLMVAANEAVGRWLVDRGLPGMFRVHDEPDRDRVETLTEFAHNFGIEAGFGPTLSPRGLGAFEAQFRGTAIAPAIRTVLSKTLTPARYTVHPSLHFGLGAPVYLHFTSPIRRYADLAVHRVVKRYLAGERNLVAADPAFETLALHVNRVAYLAGQAEAERHRMLVARLLASRVGERAAGNIVGVKPFGLVVQLQGTGVTGTVALDALPEGPYRVEPHAVASEKRRYGVGDPIEVEIAGTNEELGRIDLVPAGA